MVCLCRGWTSSLSIGQGHDTQWTSHCLDRGALHEMAGWYIFSIDGDLPLFRSPCNKSNRWCTHHFWNISYSIQHTCTKGPSAQDHFWTAPLQLLNCLLWGAQHKGTDRMVDDDIPLCSSVTISHLVGEVAKAFPSWVNITVRTRALPAMSRSLCFDCWILCNVGKISERSGNSYRRLLGQ